MSYDFSESITLHNMNNINNINSVANSMNIVNNIQVVQLTIPPPPDYYQRRQANKRICSRVTSALDHIASSVAGSSTSLSAGERPSTSTDYREDQGSGTSPTTGPGLSSRPQSPIPVRDDDDDDDDAVVITNVIDSHDMDTIPTCFSAEQTETSKQPIRTRYLGHVTG
eukprot:sb/3472341/